MKRKHMEGSSSAIVAARLFDGNRLPVHWWKEVACYAYSYRTHLDLLVAVPAYREYVRTVPEVEQQVLRAQLRFTRQDRSGGAGFSFGATEKPIEFVTQAEYAEFVHNVCYEGAVMQLYSYLKNVHTNDRERHAVAARSIVCCSVDNLPCYVIARFSSGRKDLQFRKFGLLHTDDDTPARKEINPLTNRITNEYYLNGKFSRKGIDLPTVEIVDLVDKRVIMQRWRYTGRARLGLIPFHRDLDRPAIIQYNRDGSVCYREYWMHGERHRGGDKPAYIDSAHQKVEFWYRGRKHRREFNDKDELLPAEILKAYSHNSVERRKFKLLCYSYHELVEENVDYGTFADLCRKYRIDIS